MVTIDRIGVDYTIYYDSENTLYRGFCNKCGGSNPSPNVNKATVQQAVVDLLTSGGSIFLKAMTLDNTVMSNLPSNVLVIEDYQGQRTFYRDGTRLRELADPIAVTISGVHAHPNSTSEEDLKVFTVSVPTIIHELTLDLSNLTQNATIRVYKKFNGNWRRLLGRTLVWETSMDVAVPLGEMSSTTDVKITIQSAVLEGASRNIPYSGWKEVWS